VSVDTEGVISRFDVEDLAHSVVVIASCVSSFEKADTVVSHEDSLALMQVIDAEGGKEGWNE
jgi:hypothetical protein